LGPIPNPQSPIPKRNLSSLYHLKFKGKYTLFNI
jgi:hypothetical protein